MTGWTAGEKHLIAETAALTPSVHNTQPWVLELHDDHEVWLYDRLISCGAAFEHVLLATRVLGWAPETEL